MSYCAFFVTIFMVCFERNWLKERMHLIEKPNLNPVKQISILARSITERKPDTRGSGEHENAPQTRIYNTDEGSSNMKRCHTNG
jgi:hypothetical protein